ncbi:hypothetical protein ACLK18_18360 [Escherichia coli]
MKPIFSRGPLLTRSALFWRCWWRRHARIADSRLGTFSQIGTYMDTAVSPFYFVSNAPRELLDGVSQKRLPRATQLELEKPGVTSGTVAEKQ